MEDDIDAVRTNVRAIVADVRAKSAQARFALVTYRDFESETGESTDYPSKTNLSFTTDINALQRELDSLDVTGGGDDPETVYSGLMASLDLPWQAGARKVAIVLGDAPPKDPEPVSGYTWNQVARRAYEIDPVEVYGIDTGELSSASFVSLVDQSGGVIYQLDAVDDIPAAIADSVTTALNKPFAWIQGPYVAPVGTTLTLDARPSYAIDGELVKYEWDFDGDGAYDQTTTAPEVDHQFNQVFDSVVGVRVTDTNGRTATGTTPVLITDDGDSTPRETDNCPDVANHGQSDFDQDGIGDVCDDTPGYTFEIVDDTMPNETTPASGVPTSPAQPTTIDTGGHVYQAHSGSPTLLGYFLVGLASIPAFLVRG